MIVAGSAVIALMLAKSENTVTTRNMPPIAAMAVPIALHAPSDANSFDAHQSSNAQTAMTSTGDTQPGRLWGGVFGDVRGIGFACACVCECVWCVKG